SATAVADSCSARRRKYTPSTTSPASAAYDARNTGPLTPQVGGLADGFEAKASRWPPWMRVASALDMSPPQTVNRGRGVAHTAREPGVRAEPHSSHVPTSSDFQVGSFPAARIASKSSR